MSLQIIVQAAQLAAAAVKIMQARNTYEEATKAVKAAAEDLGSKWEGAARDAFVAEQQKAYVWHVDIIRIVTGFIDAINKAKEEYERAEQTLAGIIKNH